MKWKVTKPYDVTSMTADNTSSNTGDKGVRGVFEDLRQKSWKEEIRLDECPLSCSRVVRITSPTWPQRNLRSP